MPSPESAARGRAGEDRLFNVPSRRAMLRAGRHEAGDLWMASVGIVGLLILLGIIVVVVVVVALVAQGGRKDDERH